MRVPRTPPLLSKLLLLWSGGLSEVLPMPNSEFPPMKVVPRVFFAFISSCFFGSTPLTYRREGIISILHVLFYYLSSD
jgi:hypothetical protein